MELNRHRFLFGDLKAFQGSIIRADEGSPCVGWQALRINRETVILACHVDTVLTRNLNRLIHTTVTKLHLEGARSNRQRHDLVSEANAKNRFFTQ